MVAIVRFATYSCIVLFIIFSLGACGSKLTGDSGTRFASNRTKTKTPTEVRTATSDVEEEPDLSNVTETSQSFATSILDSGEITIDLEANAASQTFTMEMERDFDTQEFTQNIRPTHTIINTQGNAAETTTKNFNQVDIGILDIALVVDDSYSMQEEQENLSTKLGPLLKSVQNSNWRIGLTTTDPGRGCITQVFMHSDPDVNQAFKQTVASLGINGSANERGFSQALNVLNCQDTQWMRPESNVAVLIVSDEDNCSKGTCSGAGPKDHNEFLKSLSAPPINRDLGVSAKVYGIIWVPGSMCQEASYEGASYQSAIDATDGVSGSICSDDFTPTLERISQDLLNSLIQQFPLGNVPPNTPVEVSVNGKPINSGYTIENNTLIFQKAPPEKAKIQVKFQSKEDTRTKVFPLEPGIEEQTLKVIVGAKVVPPKSYSYDTQTGMISFKRKPQAGSEIVASFKRVGEMKRSFKLKQVPINGEMEAIIDGTPTQAFEIDEDAKKIIFNSPPPDGAKIKLVFTTTETKVLRYDLALSELENTTMEVLLEDGSIPRFEANGTTITIHEDDFIEGATFTVSYYSLDNSGSIILNQNPMEGSLEVTGLETCLNHDASYIFHQDTGEMTFNCTRKDTNRITINYDYLTGVAHQFSYTAGPINAGAMVTVFVNGEEIEEFYIEGTLITIPGLPPEGEVLVVVENPA